MSRYGLKPFLEAFPTWGKALKAAKLVKVLNGLFTGIKETEVDNGRPRP
jgi:hypothetical protein